MMHRNLLFSPLLLPLLLSIAADAEVTTYRATLNPTASSTFPELVGFVAIFTDSETLSVGYAGIVTGLEDGLVASTCNATNGCGVHIHNGTSCTNATTQGGHYYGGDVTEDPWIDARYSSNADGKANFQGVLNMGTIDIEGRVFLVHSENGTRIGCGVIKPEEYNDETQNLLDTNTVGLTDTEVASIVNAYAVNDGVVCYFGSAINLEPDLTSYLSTGAVAGTDCNFTNGCGVHIHNGTSCVDKASQGGHLYDAEAVPEDPWLLTMYHSTSDKGDAQFVGCVETGIDGSFANYPFIVHSNNGSRVSCGILKAMNSSGLPPGSKPVKPPVSAPSGSSAATTQFVLSVMTVVSAIMTTAWTVLSFV